MPTTFAYVFAPDDEKQFFAFLEQYNLTAYPERIPLDFKPIVVNAAGAGELTEAAYYLAAEQLGEVVVRSIKRGKDRGAMEIDEILSPVFHYQRSMWDELGQLRSGRLWSELNLTGDMQKNPVFTEGYRRLTLKMQDYMKTQTLRSQPSGWYIGHAAAKLSKAGTILREAGRKGGTMVPYRPPKQATQR